MNSKLPLPVEASPPGPDKNGNPVELFCTAVYTKRATTGSSFLGNLKRSKNRQQIRGGGRYRTQESIRNYEWFNYELNNAVSHMNLVSHYYKAFVYLKYLFNLPIFFKSANPESFRDRVACILVIRVPFFNSTTHSSTKTLYTLR